MNSHELSAELERLRRDVIDRTVRTDDLVNPDQVAARRQRLEQAEAEEQDILAELERLNPANEVPCTPVSASRSELASDLR